MGKKACIYLYIGTLNLSFSKDIKLFHVFLKTMVPNSKIAFQSLPQKHSNKAY